MQPTIEKENDLLKKILAEKELEGRLKDELIKKKYAWEQVIINYLQPADLLNKEIHVEIRNDNGLQFACCFYHAFFFPYPLRCLPGQG